MCDEDKELADSNDLKQKEIRLIAERDAMSADVKVIEEFRAKQAEYQSRFVYIYHQNQSKNRVNLRHVRRHVALW